MIRSRRCPSRNVGRCCVTLRVMSIPRRTDDRHRAWVREAVRRIEADFQRSSDTHLIPLPVPGFAQVDLYLKDESSHPTGSLKHRLARSLFLHALCNGWLHEGSTVVEASSGSTVPEVRTLFDRAAEVDNITSMKAKDLEITKDGETIVVKFAYQREIHLAGPAYLTLKYTGQSNN